MEQNSVSLIKNSEKTFEIRLELKAKGPPRIKIALTYSKMCRYIIITNLKNTCKTRIFKYNNILKQRGCVDVKQATNYFVSRV